MALTDKLKAIGNAIRAKTGGTEELTLDQMVTEIEGIEGGSGGDSGWVVCEETAPSKRTTIDKLNGLRLSLPNATDFELSAFYDCTSLTSVDLPVATSIGAQAFQTCTNLTSVNSPVATSIGEYAFRYCASLTSVNSPVATSIGAQAFGECTSLTTIDLPSATTIGRAAFQTCTNLTSVDLPVATNIEYNAFYECTNLSTIILRTTETVCSVDVTAVLGTKIMTKEGLPTGEGFVYIPAAMFEYYRAAYEPAFEQMGAAGVFDLLFRKIEDYPEICG